MVVSWDPSLFVTNYTNTISIYCQNGTGTDDSQKLVTNFTAPNSEGALILQTLSEWLNGSDSASFNISMTSELLHSTEDGARLVGPIIRMERESNSTKTPSKSSKKIGEEAGIPAGLVLLLVAIAALAGFYYIRKHRAQQGYTGSKVRNQRIPKTTPPIGGRAHHRDPSFHDEPTRGVELQNRNGSGNDSWDWGSPDGSPTRAGGGGNAFRDEISRQRSGR